MVKCRVYVNELKKIFEECKSKTYLIPVIKNNANGLGIQKMFDLYSSYEDFSYNGILATAYASEWLNVDDRGKSVRKLGWTWDIEDKRLLDIRNLHLGCKTFNQLKHCVKNNIPVHLEFNLFMNRGGFNISDIPQIKDIIDDRIIFIYTHCPFEDERIKMYIDRIDKFKKYLETSPIKDNIFLIHTENSAVYRYKEKHNIQHDGSRLGEYLLLPREHETIEYIGNILTTHGLSKSDNIGYGKLSEYDENIAVVTAGYYNFNNLYYIMKNGNMYPVRCIMHDSCIVGLGDDFASEGEEVILMNHEIYKKASEDGSCPCIQRFWKINPDMIEYEYIE